MHRFLVLMLLALSWLRPVSVAAPVADPCGTDCMCIQLLGHCECVAESPEQDPLPVPLRATCEARPVPMAPSLEPVRLTLARVDAPRDVAGKERSAAQPHVRLQARLCVWRT
ncbi:MAG: hypothetical protein ACK58T_48595 [Phycisphaerae bacterium]